MCEHCGWKNHKSNACKFKKAICHACGTVGHLATVCSKKKNKKSEPVNFIDSGDEFNNENNFCFSNFSNFSPSSVKELNRVDESNFSIFSVGLVEKSVKAGDEVNNSLLYVLPIEIDGVQLEMTCDTGAPLSLMSLKMFDRLYSKKQLRKCSLNFTSYGGENISVIGEFDASIFYKGQTRRILFIVTDTNSPPLLARNFLRTFGFNLIQSSKQINSVESYS